MNLPKKFRQSRYWRAFEFFFDRKCLSVSVFSRFSYIKVYSHPRSGTHFLEAFLAKNFYPKDDFFTPDVVWGHWSNRQINAKGNPYGKLFGHHRFPSESEKKTKQPMIYIYRDPRAVAYSIWKTENFINPSHRGISFSDFLRLKLDWYGSPSIKSDLKWTIAKHWFHHVHAWHLLNNENLLIVRYEDLKDNPEKIYSEILKKFFPLRNYLTTKGIRKKIEIDPISKPLGLLPNNGLKGSWKKVFTVEDELYFLGQIQDRGYIKK